MARLAYNTNSILVRLMCYFGSDTSFFSLFVSTSGYITKVFSENGSKNGTYALKNIQAKHALCCKKRCETNRKEGDSNHLPVQGEDIEDGGSISKNMSSTVTRE